MTGRFLVWYYTKEKCFTRSQKRQTRTGIPVYNLRNYHIYIIKLITEPMLWQTLEQRAREEGRLVGHATFFPEAHKRCPARVVTLLRDGDSPPAQPVNMPMSNYSNDRAIDVVIDASESGDEEFGIVVLTAIADEMGADPASLPPIGNSIDPDILNGLRKAGSQQSNALSFEYLGYEVVVTGGGVIRIRSLA